MSRKWLPVTRDERKPERTEDRALAEKEVFDDKVAALRKATGRKEQRVVPFICARSGRHYAVIFERVSPAHNFRIASIEKEQNGEGQSGLFARLARRGISGQTSFSSDEFDTSGLYCPWCETKGGSVYCDDCGHHVCRGRTRTLENGTKLFACHDRCGSSGELVPYSKFHGTRRKGISQAAKRFLPGGNRKRLVGKSRKRLGFSK